MTGYEVIYRRFLTKIEDTKLADLPEEESEKLLLEWLNTALSYIEFDGLIVKNNLLERDETEKSFLADLTDAEIEGLALYMVAAWYEPMVNALEHTTLFYGSKDEKWSNQKEHWNQTASIQEKYRWQARKCFRNYRYKHNAYTGDS